MKIDVFCHVMPERYKKQLYRYADKFPTEKAVQDKRPVLTDNEARFTKLAPYEGMLQVITYLLGKVETKVLNLQKEIEA